MAEEKKGQWTRDEQGNIRDPEGYKWEGKKFEVDSGVDLDVPGQGDERVIRKFSLLLPMNAPSDTEVYKHHRPFFEATLKKMGLKQDADHPVRFYKGYDGNHVTLDIVMVCKPAQFFAYEGMKHGQGGKGDVLGVPLSAGKASNVGRFLKEDAKKKENKKKT